MGEVGCTKSPASRQGPNLGRELALLQALGKKESPSTYTYAGNSVCLAGQEPRARGCLSHETSPWPGWDLNQQGHRWNRRISLVR